MIFIQNIDIINDLAEKMGIKFVIVKPEELFKHKNINISKILDISKPNRPEVKEFFQKQLEALEK